MFIFCCILDVRMCLNLILNNMACDKLWKSFPASSPEQKLEALGLKLSASSPTTPQHPHYFTLPLIVAFKIVGTCDILSIMLPSVEFSTSLCEGRTLWMSLSLSHVVFKCGTYVKKTTRLQGCAGKNKQTTTQSRQGLLVYFVRPTQYTPVNCTFF